MPLYSTLYPSVLTIFSKPSKVDLHESCPSCTICKYEVCRELVLESIADEIAISPKEQRTCLYWAAGGLEKYSGDS